MIENSGTGRGEEEKEEGAAAAATAAGDAMDFHSLPRRELQALCKKNRIPANMTNVAMADALRALKSVEGVAELQGATAAAQFLSPQKPEARAGADVPRTSRRTSTCKLPAALVEPKEQQASPLPRARRVTVKASEIMSLVTESEGDKAEEKDLGTEQVVPPAPAPPMMQETIPRTTRKRASKKEEAKEKGGDDAMEAVTIKTPATRNGGRRTTTRRAVATSAPAEEAQEEQMVAPSRTARRTRQTSKPPASGSVAASATLRRSTRARGTVSKMSPLAPDEASQQEKDAETMVSLDSEIRLQELDVVQEMNNSDTETCPSASNNINQILGEVEDDKLMKEDSEQQDEGVEIDSHNKEDDVLALSGDKSSEEVLEEKVGETSEICDQDCVEQGEQIEKICQGEEESRQADNSLSGLEGSPVLGLISSFEDLVISELEDKQSVQDEDNSLVLQETKDAATIVGQQVEGEKFSLEDLVINGDVADNQSTHAEDKSLEIGETKDAGSDPLGAQEAENGNVSLEVESENFSTVLVEGSGESPYSRDTDASGDDGSSDILAEVEELSRGNSHSDTADDADSYSCQKIPSPASNLQKLTESTGGMLALEADVIKECAEPPSEKLEEVSAEVENTAEKHGLCFEAQEIYNMTEITLDVDKVENLQKLTESTGDTLSPEADVIKECAEPPSEKLGEVSAEVENTAAEKHGLCLEAEEICNKENMTEITVGVEYYKVKSELESGKQNIDLKNCSLRKLKSLLREKISNDNQKIEKKRAALAQLNENCLQRAS